MRGASAAAAAAVGLAVALHAPPASAFVALATRGGPLTAPWHSAQARSLTRELLRSNADDAAAEAPTDTAYVPGSAVAAAVDGGTAAEVEQTQPDDPVRSRPSGKPAVLDRSCPWRLFLSLRDPDGSETGPSTDVAVVIRFVEEPGFEPPGGRVEVLEDNRFVPIKQGKFARWTLSEDPDDRKDSLWIWGLFRQLPFPYLLFQLEVADIPLPSGAGARARSLPAGKLYAKIPHKYTPEAGSVLSRGDVGVKFENIVAADLAGLATADIGEVKQCGSARLVPLEFAPGVQY